MPRPKLAPRDRRSHLRCVRLHQDEEAGLHTLAAALGISPSRIMRRLIREAINGGPDYFKDGEKEIRMMHVHLAAVGRNLNQLVKAINRGELVPSEDLVRVLDIVRLQVAGIEDHYMKAVRAAAWRSWEALYQEADLSPPYDEAEAVKAGQYRRPQKRRRAQIGPAAGASSAGS